MPTTAIVCSCAGLALGFAAKRGAARNGVELSLPVWAVAALCAMTACALAVVAPSTSLVELLVICAALVCALTDAATGFIFDEVSLGACAFVALAAVAQHRLAGALGGSLIVALFFAAVFAAGALSGRELHGGGDVKIMLAAGALLGPAGALACIAATYGGAALYTLPPLLMGKIARDASVRLGPFIVLGVLVATMKAHAGSAVR